MPSVDLYLMPVSAPCRAVLLAAKSIGVDVNQKVVDLMKGEQMTPEFLKMNPCHTIPTMDDNGFYLGESRAIITYLASQYGGDAFYPKEPKKRANVDQRLYFDTSISTRMGKYYGPLMRGAATEAGLKEAAGDLETALGFLETFLTNDGPWIAGDQMTLADFAIVANVSSIANFPHVSMDKFPKVKQWLALCADKMDGYEELNGNGAKQFGGWIQSMMAKLQ